MHKRVSISIHRGTVKADYSGFVGSECEEMAERIDPGEMTVEDKQYKPEFDMLPNPGNTDYHSHES